MTNPFTNEIVADYLAFLDEGKPSRVLFNRKYNSTRLAMRDAIHIRSVFEQSGLIRMRGKDRTWSWGEKEVVHFPHKTGELHISRDNNVVTVEALA